MTEHKEAAFYLVPYFAKVVKLLTRPLLTS